MKAAYLILFEVLESLRQVFFHFVKGGEVAEGIFVLSVGMEEEDSTEDIDMDLDSNLNFVRHVA